MKIILFLLCSSVVAFSQIERPDLELNRIGNLMAIEAMKRDQDRQAEETRRFQETMRQTTDNILQARIIKLQRERAERDDAALQSQIVQSAVPAQAVTKEPEKEKQASEPIGRFQLISDNGIVLKIDTITGETWQFSKSTNGNSWIDVSDVETRTKVLIQKRTLALNNWETETDKRDPSFKNFKEPFIKLATEIIEKKTADTGRFLTEDEMVEQAEIAYKTTKTKWDTTFLNSLNATENPPKK